MKVEMFRPCQSARCGAGRVRAAARLRAGGSSGQVPAHAGHRGPGTCRDAAMAAPPHPARIAAPGHEDGGHEDFVKTGRQPEVTAAMRETVAEWLLAVCEEEAAHPALFCLAVNCLDR